VVNRAVFLDRDGVINHPIVRDKKPYAPRSFCDFKLIEGIEDSVIKMSNLDFLIFVVTNQPDIGNGLVDRVEVEKMHASLAFLPIEKIYICPHSQNEGCVCRKPRAGMLFQARDEYDLNLSESFFIGDRISDMEAGSAANCKCVFIDYNYKETGALEADYICSHVSQTIKFIEGCVDSYDR
jgi:D-glycero-D-manno-heptose 1,7-bisphosphate phosphatase